MAQDDAVPIFAGTTVDSRTALILGTCFFGIAFATDDSETIRILNINNCSLHDDSGSITPC
jgi:hypothetical protein